MPLSASAKAPTAGGNQCLDTVDAANANTKVNGVADVATKPCATPEVRALAAPSLIMAGVYTDGSSSAPKCALNDTLCSNCKFAHAPSTQTHTQTHTDTEPARKKRRILPDWLMNPKPDAKILVEEEDPDAENPLEEEENPGAENEEAPDAENSEPVVATPRVTKQLSRLDFSRLLTNSSTLRLGQNSKIKSKRGNKKKEKLSSHTVGQRKITSFILTKKSESSGGGFGTKTGEPQAMAIVQENDSHINSQGITGETFKTGCHLGNPHSNTDASIINNRSEEGDKYPETSQQVSEIQPFQARQRKSNRT